MNRLACRSALASFVLYLPWLLLPVVAAVLAYLYLQPSPLEISYVAPHFTSEPVRTRDAAAAAAIVHARGGTTVYRYVEYCVHKPHSALIQRAWVTPSLVWHAPDVSAATAGEVGCFARPFAIELPQSAPSRSFSFVQRMHVTVNQVRVHTITLQPIPLRILSPADADRLGL